MPEKEVIKQAAEAMHKAVEYAIHEFAGVRTGKASPGLVEGLDVKVASYGSTMKLKQMAMIGTPEPRLITIQPFDPGTTHDIERAIKESKLGINPSVDGKTIRLPIPELSEERRKDLVKLIKDMAEQARVRVRSARHEGMDKIKALQKDGSITEDDLHRLQKEVQDLTDKHVKDIDEHVAKKEVEVMTV
jgi:ribosome recycling factor